MKSEMSEVNNEIKNDTKDTQIIDIKIDNLIRKHCSNFLSYLYANLGWKRTMFDMAKEAFIDSSCVHTKHTENNKCRIVITETAIIQLKCYNVIDILNCMEFIYNSFEYGRMSYYLVFDHQVVVKSTFIDTIKIAEYNYSVIETMKSDFGLISLLNNEATITYTIYENGNILRNIIRDVFLSASTNTSKPPVNIKKSLSDSNIKVVAKREIKSEVKQDVRSNIRQSTKQNRRQNTGHNNRIQMQDMTPELNQQDNQEVINMVFAPLFVWMGTKVAEYAL